MQRVAILVVVLGAACTTKTTKAQDLCARASAMFEKCEQFDGSGSDAALTKEMMIDRWRGLCRAVLTGQTAQLMANSRELYQSMDEGTKAGLRLQAECTAKAATCDDYAKCGQ